MCDIAPGKKYCSDYCEQNAGSKSAAPGGCGDATRLQARLNGRGLRPVAPRAPPGNYCCRL
jgi:hypothetical protein